MKGPRLLSSEDATPAEVQTTLPCTDCPFARTALNGWLGGMPIEEWIAAAHSESRMECHVHPNIQCAGAAIYRGNLGKMPRDPSILILPADRERVFKTPMEFEAHHRKTPSLEG